MSLYSVRHGLNFSLNENWTRTVDNPGGYPVVRYTANVGAGMHIMWRAVKSDNVVPSAIGFSVEPGLEILVIGDTVHLPIEIAALSVNPYS